MSKHAILSWFAAAGLLAASASALERTAALGGSGEIYQVTAGSYRDLFPEGKETSPGNPVLAIEVTKPGTATQKVLVPYTKGAEPESSPALLYEDDSNTLFLVWESRISTIHSVLILASFDGARWSNPIQINSNPFSSKSSPQLAITRDTVPVASPESTLKTRRRTILHLLWEEEIVAGNYETLYSPVILEDGIYLGWNPLYHLSDFVPDGDSGSPFGPPSALLQSPVLQSGGDTRTTVVAFASSGGRWITSVVIDVLPEELSQLAEKLRSSIIDIGRQGTFPGNRPALAEKARQSLVEQGSAFHSDVIQYMADQVFGQILADRGDDLVSLGDKMRSSIIDIGVRLSGRGLRDRGEAAKSKIEEIYDPQPRPDVPPPHLFHLRAASSRPIPEVGATGLRWFVSEGGEDMLITWSDKDRVFYRVSQGNGWSDQREIKLSGSLSLDRAYEILAQRVHNR